MSAFQDQLATDLAHVFNPDEGAVSVVYTPKGGAAIPDVPMIIDYGAGDGGPGSDELNTSATGLVMVSDIAQASEGDQVDIGSEAWLVEFGKLIEDGLYWKVWMSRETR